MKWFNNPTSMDDVKRQYKALIRVYHPDNGGDLDKMQEINAEYNELCERYENGYQSNTGGGDDFTRMVKPQIEAEISKTCDILVEAYRAYPDIVTKYERLIAHDNSRIYSDLPTVLKVAYDEMQQKQIPNQNKYQFVGLMSELENLRRTSQQIYANACRQYGRDFNLEISDLQNGMGNNIREQIQSLQQNGFSYMNRGGRGYYNPNYNSSYPRRDDGCNDCCQCLGLMMCFDCVDCC
ncbi:MAG TPA: hypothetical protein VHQ24_14065 [Lachnospiraceae bacterium]|jgi:curved DNA-binding protein CbpA|nr:hypothetical protein [Lachnospiraceae bacterium]